jgi:phosphatidylserine decarboxylase
MLSGANTRVAVGDKEQNCLRETVSVRFGGMAAGSDGGDVRRRAGWLPLDQDDLESWLDGHRERVEAKGEQVALHPVLTEFQELIDTDPVVRLYVNEMIAQVPRTKRYRKRHLESVSQLVRLINEVLTMAPEFGENVVTIPLGAILDWATGTPAGFAAFRDPRVNAMLKKILTAWCEFLQPLMWRADVPRGPLVGVRRR